MKNKFTLIELIAVIGILGILAAMIIPNISSFQGEATETAIKADAKNLQTSVDMYQLDHYGNYPSEVQPEIGNPQPIKFDLLYPKYLREIPKHDGVYYWVDYQGKVWLSPFDSPVSVVNDGTKVSWTEVNGADYYNVFEVVDPTTGAVNHTQKLKFLEKVSTNEYSKEVADKTFLVNAVSNKGFESAPVSSEYKGYVNPSLPINSGNDLEQKPNVPIPPTFKWDTNDLSNVFDGDYNTSSIVGSPEYITWEGDLVNRSIEIKMGISSMYKDAYFQMIDINENPVQFIDISNGGYISVWKVSSGNPQTKTFIVPENAVKLKFYRSVSSLANLSLYEIKVNDDLILPNSITNISATSTDSSITLNWDKDSTVEKVAIYKGTTLVGYSNTNSFTDKSLYSDTSYDYTFRSIGFTGNYSPSISFMYKTLRPEIVWRGFLDAKAFDNDFNTASIIGTTSQYVTWEGDLVNRSVEIKMGVSGMFNDIDFEMIDINGNLVQFIDTSDGTYISRWRVRSDGSPQVKSFIVPENVVKFEFKADSTAYIYEINVNDDLHLPNSVTNISATATDNSITMTWDQDSTVAKVAIYKGTTFLGYFTDGSFIDKSLYSDTSYNYTFRSVGTTGNYSSPLSFTYRTIRPEIVWRGFSDAKAFDGDDNTFSYMYGNTPQYVTWEGDLANRNVEIKMGAITYENIYFQMLDSTGALVSFIDPSTGASTTSWSVRGSTPLIKSFTIPDNVVKFKFYGSYSARSYIYEIKAL